MRLALSDPAEWLTKLEILRESIPSLENSGPDAVEFLDWHESFLKITEEVFGNESSELVKIQALRFELPADPLESFKHHFTDPDQPEESMKHRNQDDPRLLEVLRAASDDPDKLVKSLRMSHFKKTLDEARDLISTMIYTLGMDQT